MGQSRSNHGPEDLCSHMNTGTCHPPASQEVIVEQYAFLSPYHMEKASLELNRARVRNFDLMKTNDIYALPHWLEQSLGSAHNLITKCLLSTMEKNKMA